MPTVNVELTSTNEVVVVKPPSNRKVKVGFVRAFNRDIVSHIVTIGAGRYDSDGNVLVSRTIDVFPLGINENLTAVGQTVPVYDLDRGEALTATLASTITASAVYLTVTYELE